MDCATERLLIRSFVEDDIEDYARIVGDARVTRFIGDGRAQDRTTAASYVRDCMAREAADGLARFAVSWRASGEFIGFSGFKRMNGVIDFGYRFAPGSWGKGVATEAGRAVLDYGRRDLRLTRVTGRVRRGNDASTAVLAKLGFRPWGYPPFADQALEWFLLET